MTCTARRAMVMIAVIIVVPMFLASPAVAHEFTLVLVESDVGAAADAGRGFRLAVDQSPDVSHPPGEDAGDHLGGVDVDVVSVDARLPSVTAEVDALLDSGATAVVVLAGGADVDAAIASAIARGKVVFTIDAGDSVNPTPGEIRLRSIGERDDRRFADFAAAFVAASGSAPTEAGALGYDAGRLVDAVVSELGEHLASGRALTGAATAAADQLVSAEVEVGSDTSLTKGAGSGGAPAVSRRGAVAVAAASCGILIVGLGISACWRRRRRLGA